MGAHMPFVICLLPPALARQYHVTAFLKGPSKYQEILKIHKCTLKYRRLNYAGTEAKVVRCIISICRSSCVKKISSLH